MTGTIELVKKKSRISLRSQAYDILRKRILSCELKPGAAITLADLAEEMNVGRTPVSQAIDRLTVDGLVEVMPRKGVVVAPVSLDDLVEICEVRILNEEQAARWAAERASKEHIERLRENLESMRLAADELNFQKLIELDSAFHRIITEAAGNSILAEFLAKLHDRSLRFWTLSLKVPGHNDRVLEQHREVVEAIATRNADDACAAIRNHIKAFRSNILEHVLTR